MDKRSEEIIGILSNDDGHTGVIRNMLNKAYDDLEMHKLDDITAYSVLNYICNRVNTGLVGILNFQKLYSSDMNTLIKESKDYYWEPKELEQSWAALAKLSNHVEKEYKSDIILQTDIDKKYTDEIESLEQQAINSGLKYSNRELVEAEFQILNKAAEIMCKCLEDGKEAKIEVEKLVEELSLSEENRQSLYDKLIKRGDSFEIKGWGY